LRPKENRLITSRQPDSWENLQDAVGAVLRECGFTVEIEKKLDTARGTVEIDVYSEEPINRRKYVILCECKHWKQRVPQNVIHAFRSVVADSGANLGYIISSAGFQSGALTAVDLTNVRLMTWWEFQEEFEATWIERYLRPLFDEMLSRIVQYTAPLPPGFFLELPEPKQDAFAALAIRHQAFGLLALLLASDDQPYKPDFQLPLRAHLDKREFSTDEIPSSVLDAKSYREFANAVLKHSEALLREFDRIRGTSG
jgi:restriction system protein